MNNQPIHIVGGGLAGSEAAWQLAQAGVPVVIHEMRPGKSTPAHTSGHLAELVCSNSLRADDPLHNAIGLLHEEMRRLGSLILAAADETKVPAGGALAVDREGFSQLVEAKLSTHPLVTIKREEIASIPEDWPSVVIAAGPLASAPLADWIRGQIGDGFLHFFDAIAPIVTKESVDFSKAWMQSRHDKGEGADYINCPMTREEYDAFVAALVEADTAEFREWEKNTPYFEGCLPIEVMAARGPRTLSFGPMKPIGLTAPDGRRPHAVIQLRQDNKLGTLYNMVGFQTKLKHSEQLRVFRTIPGLEQAEFVRLGGMHRNTFINSPTLLDASLRLKSALRIRFAGQISGCEGYVESAAMGLLAGRFAAAERLAKEISLPPTSTAIGALLAHVTGGANAENFQPMNVNFGLFPPLPEDSLGKKRPKGASRKEMLSRRGMADLAEWMGGFSFGLTSL
jgi:methylenetetrahydrofolate--tRNA-(uracil-5-)-methyltransferase